MAFQAVWRNMFPQEALFLIELFGREPERLRRGFTEE
jgi:hypothetical protein